MEFQRGVEVELQPTESLSFTLQDWHCCRWSQTVSPFVLNSMCLESEVYQMLLEDLKLHLPLLCQSPVSWEPSTQNVNILGESQTTSKSLVLSLGLIGAQQDVSNTVGGSQNAHFPFGKQFGSTKVANS